MKRLALAASLAAAQLGCASPDVTFSRDYRFAKVRRVAVASFDGKGGQAAADFLAHALLATGAEVVERSRLEAVLGEQRLKGQGRLGPDGVRRVGRLLGVDAVFLGTVTQFSPAQSYLVVAGSPTIVAAGASPLGPGKHFVHAPALGAPGAGVLTSNAVVSLTARLVDVESGAVVWSAHHSYEGFDLDSAMSAVASALAKTLAHLWKR